MKVKINKKFKNINDLKNKIENFLENEYKKITDLTQAERNKILNFRTNFDIKADELENENEKDNDFNDGIIKHRRIL